MDVLEMIHHDDDAFPSPNQYVDNAKSDTENRYCS
jgi:hypothetical protein